MLEVVALGNVALNLGLRFAFPYFIGRLMRLPFLNFVTFPLLATLPIEMLRLIGGPVFLIDGGITSPSYQSWLMIENASAAIGLIMSVTISALAFRYVNPAIAEPRLSNNSQSLQIAAIALIAISLVSFVIASSLSYGTINWILSPRTGYQFYRDGVGPFYALMTTALSVGAFFALLSVRTSRIKIPLIAVGLLPLAYLTGSKGVILTLFVLAATIYLFTFKRIPLWTLIVAACPVAGLMLVQFGSADLVDIFSYFDYYFNTTMIYDALTSNHISYFGGLVTLSDYWGLVPRGIYPDKPYVYGGVILSELIYPGSAELGSTVGFGGPINAFADFGFAGVILATVLNPGAWVGAFLFGTTARIVATFGPDAMKGQVKFVLILFYLLDAQALGYFAFPLNIVFLGFLAAVLSFAGFVRISFGRPAAPIQLA